MSMFSLSTHFSKLGYMFVTVERKNRKHLAMPQKYAESLDGKILSRC